MVLRKISGTHKGYMVFRCLRMKREISIFKCHKTSHTKMLFVKSRGLTNILDIVKKCTYWIVMEKHIAKTKFWKK
jgi:hypothetical protein